MHNHDIPLDAPHDAIMASPMDVQAMAEWVSAVFTGRPAILPSRGLLGADTIPPFTFDYAGKSSATLLPNWRRTVGASEHPEYGEHLIQWHDSQTGLTVTARVKVFRHYPAVDWVLAFENQGTQDSPLLENIQALDTGLRTEKTDGLILHRINGDLCDERSFLPFDTDLRAWRHDHLSFAPLDGHGRSSNGAFPFFNLEYRANGIIAAIGWSGQWAVTLERAPDGPTRLQAGMEKTHLSLHPGERIRSPRILLMAWQGDRMAAHNRFRRLMLYHYLPRQDGRPPCLPIASQSFCRYYTKRPEWATEAGQIAAARFAQSIGCDTLWLDAAWFEGGFPDGVGNWYPRSKDFPNGLHPIASACHALGLKFLAWFEPEQVAAGSRIDREHPEFVFRDGKKGLFRLDDPTARRWLTELLSQRITEYGLDIYRNDFNIDPVPFWRRNDAPDRQGMTEIRYVEGLYEMWDELRLRHPGLLIDNCASGGRRIDLETSMRSLPLWRSDTGCAAGHADWDQAQSYGLSLYIPLHSIGSWAPDPYVCRSAVTAGGVFEWPFLDADFPMDLARDAIAELKENRKYWYGDFYPLTSCTATADEWIAWQLHRSDLGAGIVQVFRRAASVYEAARFHLQGLDPEMRYAVQNLDETGTIEMSGRELMDPGLRLDIADRPKAVILKYHGI